MPIKDKNLRERLVAENVTEAVWLRLRRLTSHQLCRKTIESRNSGLPEDILANKSNGMAWAIRSALGYWDTKSGGLNAQVLSRYYALLQISIAEQIASGDANDDLPSIQRHTEYGHGLFTLSKPELNFPENYLIGCLKSGHFPAYCGKRNLKLSSYALEKRLRSSNEAADLSKTISLHDLIRRVPELQSVIAEYLNTTPLSFQIGHAHRNFSERAEKMSAHAAKTGQILFNPPHENGALKKTYVAIYPHGQDFSIESFDAFGFPITNICKSNDGTDGDEYFVGELMHPENDLWWDHIETYKSGYCGTSIIVPFWGINDPFILHLTILYAFSIIVRYLPDLWHEIESGKLDHIRALLEHYLVVVDNVLPKIAIERLTGVRLLISQPGSMSAPI